MTNQQTNDKAEITIKFLGDMQKISLSPNDVIVIQSEALLGIEQEKNIKQAMNATFPFNKCVVMCGRLKFSVAENAIDTSTIGERK